MLVYSTLQAKLSAKISKEKTGLKGWGSLKENMRMQRHMKINLVVHILTNFIITYHNILTLFIIS